MIQKPILRCLRYANSTNTADANAGIQKNWTSFKECAKISC